jgi:hypothetical protein
LTASQQSDYEKKLATQVYSTLDDLKDATLEGLVLCQLPVKHAQALYDYFHPKRGREEQVDPVIDDATIKEAFGITPVDKRTALVYIRTITNTVTPWLGRQTCSDGVKAHISLRHNYRAGQDKEYHRIMLIDSTKGGGKTRSMDEICDSVFSSTLKGINASYSAHVIKLNFNGSPTSAVIPDFIGSEKIAFNNKENAFFSAWMGWWSIYTLISHRISNTVFVDQVHTVSGWRNMTFAKGVEIVRNSLNLPSTCFTLVAMDETLGVLKKISTDEFRAQFMTHMSQVLTVNQVTFVLMTALTRSDVALAMSSSGRKPVWLPHPMLNEDDTLALAKALCTEKNDAKWHPCFQIALADVIGIPRYIADVCSEYNLCQPENVSYLTTFMLHPTEDTTLNPLLLDEDIVCANFLPNHRTKFEKASTDVLEKLSQSGLLALQYKGAVIVGIRVPPFILASWSNLTASPLGRLLKNMFAIDMNANYLTSEKAFEEFLLWYEVVRRFCFLKAGIHSVTISEYFCGAELHGLMTLPDDLQATMVKIPAFPESFQLSELATFPCAGLNVTSDQVIHPTAVTNPAIDATTFVGSDFGILTIHQQMKNTKHPETPADILEEMIASNAKNAFTVDGKPPARTINVLYTLTASKPTKVLPANSVFLNKKALEQYLAPVGNRMLIAWK